MANNNVEIKSNEPKPSQWKYFLHGAIGSFFGYIIFTILFSILAGIGEDNPEDWGYTLMFLLAYMIQYWIIILLLGVIVGRMCGGMWESERASAFGGIITGGIICLAMYVILGLG